MWLSTSPALQHGVSWSEAAFFDVAPYTVPQVK